MTYPPCPFMRDDCRFVSEGGMTTCIHSPLVYDRGGRPVAGGSNTVQGTTRCLACGKRFLSSQTELARAQGQPPEWKEGVWFAPAV